MISQDLLKYQGNEDYSAVFIRELAGRVKAELKAFRRLFSQLCERPFESDDEKDFYEGFQLIDRCARTLIRESEHDFLICDRNEFPLISAIILKHSRGGNFPDEREISLEINKEKKRIYIPSDNFSFITFEISYSIIKCIYDILFNKKTHFGLSLHECIKLLTGVSEIDSEYIIKCCDPIELVYSAEKSGIYNQCDERTRAQYRSKTTRIAQLHGKTENDIAFDIFKKANTDNRHIGFYIFEEYDKCCKRIKPYAYTAFILSAAAVLSIILSLFNKSILLFFVLLLPFYSMTKYVFDFFIMRKSQASYLPRFSCNSEAVKKQRAVFVISAIVTKDSIAQLCERMKEQYFIDDEPIVCALCDLPQSSEQISDSDEEILTSLSSEHEQLSEISDSFIFIVRRREYSDSSGTFSGKERKRGAILALCRYCVENDKSEFSKVFGNIALLDNSPFLILLDSDTKSLMTSARTLISCALHPLNMPKAESNRVVSGYGILAPNITTSLKASLKTPFSHLFGGVGSLSVYDTFTPNLYQDAFGESIFCGKGLVHTRLMYSLTKDLFKDNRILSHDIAEGCILRCGFVGDAHFEDSFPSALSGYLKRGERWIRGDIQNLPFLLGNISTKNGRINNPFSLLDRFKTADNIARAVLPVVLFFMLFLSFFGFGNFTSVVTLFSIAMPYILSLISSTVDLRAAAFSTRYYSGIANRFVEIISSFLLNFLFLPVFAINSLIAISKALYRMAISKKQLLQWQTFAQTEMGKKCVYHYITAELLCFILLLSPSVTVRLYALIWIFAPFCAYLLSRPYNTKRAEIYENRLDEIKRQVRDMWGYYEKYCNRKNNYLPPDNVQYAPVFRVCHRTSPTNIGMYLLSCLAVYDFNIISTDELLQRIDRTLASVEALQKYKGNLYNWYETKTLKISPNPFVSTVDSGNFVCSLVALSQGLNELDSKLAGELVQRCERIIENTDLSVFYNEKRKLFSIGINPADNSPSPNHYDLLMSESRMTSYFAVASKTVSKEHWQRLERTMSKAYCNGFIYSGAVSYSGTMFEFFMPELLLKSENGSLCYESLRYALFCQKMRVQKIGVPFGISESAYFAFDSMLNFQYKAHGVQAAGLKSGLDSELVISPYSTYLSMMIDFNGAFENLERLKEYGVYGNYGFYEAVDFTIGRGERFGAIIKSYMAHHIGMSILGCANACLDGIMQKRFMNDNAMASARELLSEKPFTGSVIYEKYNDNSISSEKEEAVQSEFFEEFSPSAARIKLMSNGEYTLACTASGLCIATYRGFDVYARTREVFTQPRGAFFAFKADDRIYHLCYYPAMRNDENQGAEFNEDNVTYYRNGGGIECGMRVGLHNTLPCEIRQLALKNTTSEPKSVKLLGFIEPVLQKTADYYAHPAFSKLFLKVSYDYDRRCVIISRKDRHGNSKLFCAVGFLEDIEFSNCFLREKALSRPDGTRALFENEGETENDHSFIPDPCVFLRHTLSLNPHEQRELHLFILIAESSEDLFARIEMIRIRENVISRSLPPLWERSVESRVTSAILPPLLLKRRDSAEQMRSIAANTLSVSSLFEFSLSSEIPIVYVEVTRKNDFERISSYLKAYKALRLCLISYQLVFSSADEDIIDEINGIISELGLTESLNTQYGVFVLKIKRNDILTLLKAVAVHTAPLEITRIGTPVIAFEYPRYKSVLPSDEKAQLACAYGGFVENGFLVDKKPPAVWCHILANQQFGTLLCSDSLGFTYAVNSYENKLTPWTNDNAFSNNGEKVLLRINGGIYDLCNGAACIFTEDNAVYKGRTDLFSSSVTVTVAQRGFCKKIDVDITLSRKCDFDIAFYTEPVLSSDRNNSRLIRPRITDKGILLFNPANLSVSGYMGVLSSHECTCLTSQESFFRENRSDNSVLPSCDICAALICNAKSKSRLSVSFYITFGRTERSALLIKDHFKPLSYNNYKRNKITITTPDKALNHMFNHQLFTQTIGGRIFARTGFYQNSGAYGFRDQLQDACACLLQSPETAMRIIARACTAQFPKGDVLHWWHSLPGGVMRGVRTKISDDLLFLPYAVAEFVEKTSNKGFLAYNISLCEGIDIPQGKNEFYGEVKPCKEKISVYNHCRLALNYAFRAGSHGLILMGSGDWNDSFNGVGIEGKGESVWLTQFMILVLNKFAKLSSLVGDTEFEQLCTQRAGALTKAVMSNAWDGQWYLRAFFDDGTPLGSAQNEACRIDSLAQSFAVLAHLPDEERNNIALDSAISQLCDESYSLIKLFIPPFDGGELPVGYASAYPTGIRENGGQYTHGAIWLCIALFETGRCEEGYRLLKMLNPFYHALTEGDAMLYKNEPYYMSADIYTNEQCKGRGGWSVYTGAAGWYYRAVFEWCLGIKILFGRVYFSYNVSSCFIGSVIKLNYLDTDITFKIEKSTGNEKLLCDNGKNAESVPLDKRRHNVILYI